MNTISFFLLIILAQLADLLTTAVGVSLGARELNPLGWCWETIVLKIAVTILVCRMLERYHVRLRWLGWIPAIVVGAAVAWNVVNIACIYLSTL